MSPLGTALSSSLARLPWEKKEGSSRRSLVGLREELERRGSVGSLESITDIGRAT